MKNSPTDRLPGLLKQVFGYDSFRPLQQEIMSSALAGNDTVAILPTGAGKSLCYQLPALVREGLTLVVSPLIALMKDQVDQLQAAGVAATYLNSTLDPAELRERQADLDSGKYKLLFRSITRPGFGRCRTLSMILDCSQTWHHRSSMKSSTWTCTSARWKIRTMLSRASRIMPPTVVCSKEAACVLSCS